MQSGFKKSAAVNPSDPKPNLASTAASRSAFSGVDRMKKSMSPVYRGRPWKASAKPPTMTYSTPLEFNNSINARKSFGSIGGLTVSLNQLEQDFQALRRSQSRVILAVCLVRL